MGKCASTRVSERVSESSSLIVERHKHTSHHAFPEVLPHQAHACRQDEAEQARAQLDPHENRKHRPVSLPSHSLTHSLTHLALTVCLTAASQLTTHAMTHSLASVCSALPFTRHLIRLLLLCCAHHSPLPLFSPADTTPREDTGDAPSSESKCLVTRLTAAFLLCTCSYSVLSCEASFR